MKSGSEETKPYEFTKRQVEVACLYGQGSSESRICEQLGIKYPSQVSDMLKRFDPTAEVIRWAEKKLRTSGYFVKKVDYAAVMGKAARENVKRMLQEEWWPFARAPFGYDIEEVRIGEKIYRRLKINPEKAQVVKELFQTLEQGKTIYKFPGLPKTINPYQIVKDPIYKGYHSLGDEILPEKHESLVIVHEQTWEQAQKMRKGPRPRAPYGYEWFSDHLIPVPEEREAICKIFKLRLEKKGCKEIAKELKKPLMEAQEAYNKAVAKYGPDSNEAKDAAEKVTIALKQQLDYHTVLDRIRNSLYKTKVWSAMGGKVKVEGEPFVDAKTWHTAQRIRISRKETAEKQRRKTENVVKSYLSERRFATAPQIAEGTEMSYSITLGALHRLKGFGEVIMKPFGSHGQLVWALKKSPEVETTGPRGTLEEVLKLGEPESLIGILECLLLQPFNTGELQKKTGLNRNALARWLKLLKENGVLERTPIKKFRQWSIKSDFMNPVQEFLEDYRSCVL